MNVIFLDIDGVLNAYHDNDDDLEKRVKILGDIVKEYNSLVVLSSSMKNAVDFNPLEIYSDYLKKIFNLFDKYNIKCIDKTPYIRKYISKNIYTDVWKEDEIIKYLENHNIGHFCIIDDDDLKYVGRSDLSKLKDYLVTTLFYSENKDEEGLLLKHKDEVGKILEKDNKFKRR